MIDNEGFRPNVGIILINNESQLFWGRRVKQDAWQFPQGGINEHEKVEEALFRELNEEVGLSEEHVKILARSKQWLKYRLPRRLVRKDRPVCIGQKQRWFLLKLIADESAINLESSFKPEFDHWQWVSYWYPLQQVISFKKEVYRKALKEFKHVAFNHHQKRYKLDHIDR